MKRGERYQLEVRTVLVTWRAVMKQIRAGAVPDSPESVTRVTRAALEMLDRIAARYRVPAADRTMADARREVQGASHSDLVPTVAETA